MFCCSSKDESDGLDLEVKKAWSGPSARLLVLLFHLGGVFPMNACCVGGCDNNVIS